MVLSTLRYLGALFLIIISFGCRNEYKVPKAIEEIPVHIQIKRFDQKFLGLQQSSLKNLKKEFPYLFPKQYADSFWLKKSNDSIQLVLGKAVQAKFPDVSVQEEALSLFFKHLKFYYPQIKTPEVVAIINDVDYKNSVVEGDNKLIIALDCYLGETHEFYQNISAYISYAMKPSQMVIDVAEIYAQKIVGKSNSRVFVSQMVHYGKQIYLTKAFVPFKKESEIMRYNDAQWEWAKVNEKFIWEYFVDKQLLFKTDKNLSSRFLQEAPFTKFYLDFDAETPGRLGQYMGYQIVCAFMKHNKVSLQQLAELDGSYIFEHSKYKPQK